LLIAAFAELQTEVIDFTSDLNVIGIPFWDYQTYTFRVLFPSHADHPVFHDNVCQVRHPRSLLMKCRFLLNDSAKNFVQE